jgi:sodium-dependent dicarboxylate transporter 2/3/5
MFRATIVLLIIVLPLLSASLLPYEQGYAAAIFFSTVVLWFTELIPLPATALLVPVLIALLGQAPAAEVFAPFGSDILFLFIGCFLLAESMQKHGWDRRMAYFLLSSPIGEKSAATIIAALAIMAWTLSMWISNTATCIMLTAVGVGIINIYKHRLQGEVEQRNFSTRLLLAIAFGATMGGLATPVGTPPNLLALQFLRNAGIELTFFDWMMVGLPVSLVMIVVLLLVLHLLFPVKLHSAESSGVRSYFKDSLSALGPVKREELQVAGVFAVAVILWVIPGALKDFAPEWHNIHEFFKPFSLSVVAVLAALVLFILPGKSGQPNLDWKDAKKIEWGTILLFGGGLVLGELLSSSGLATSIGAAVFSEGMGIFLMIFTVVICSVFLSEFASNTASASIIIPILLGTLASIGVGESGVTLFVLAAAFGASFGFMLPVSTPPNAIVYGTGQIRLKDMVRAGIIFDLIGAAVITTWVWILL